MSTKQLKTPPPRGGRERLPSGRLGGALTKQELAMMYCPNVSPRSALGTLRRWITRCAVLCKELQESGYTKSQHILSVQQVRLIMQYLGEPG